MSTTIRRPTKPVGWHYKLATISGMNLEHRTSPSIEQTLVSDQLTMLGLSLMRCKASQ